MNVLSALNDFILSCQADGLRPATIRWYESILTAFAGHHGHQELTTITTTILREYIVALRERVPYADAPQKPSGTGKMSDSSVAGHITALHAFWGWCSREYDIKNPMQNIKRPRRQQQQPKANTAADFMKLLQATGDKNDGVRDRALLCFLADTGCRLGGLLSLKIESLQLDQRRAIVTEKGNKTRIVVFTQLTATLLRHWLWVRQSQTDYVFVNIHTGNVLTVSGVNQLLKRLKRRSGVKGRVNPHSFRHGFAREYLTNGGDMATLARLLGHSSIQTTIDFYAIFTPDELAELHNKFSPLNSYLSDGTKG